MCQVKLSNSVHVLHLSLQFVSAVPSKASRSGASQTGPWVHFLHFLGQRGGEVKTPALQGKDGGSVGKNRNMGQRRTSVFL